MAHPFWGRVAKPICERTYLIDGRGLAKIRSQTAFRYESPLEQYVKLKSISPGWKTELDLFHLWSDDNWTNPDKQGHSLFLLTPSTNIPTHQRQEMIQYGVQHSHSDLILLWKSDAESLVSMGLATLKQDNLWYCTKLPASMEE